jgi:hypothetical protein
MDEVAVKRQKNIGPAKSRQTGTFFWQTPMVQRFEIVCTATCAAAWRNMPTRCLRGLF